MPPGRKPSFVRDDFVAAAIAYADAHGLEHLTLRALGIQIGAATTAVYRYFHDKEALIFAMREELLRGVAGVSAPAEMDPDEVLMAAAQAFRSAVRLHPCLGQIMALPATNGENSEAVQTFLLMELRRLGLTGGLLVRGYQQIESFVAGSSMFDFADAPAHLTDRFMRLAAMKDEELTAVLRNPTAVERNNEDAFMSSLRAIIDGLVNDARTQSS